MRRYPLIDDDFLIFSGHQTTDQVSEMLKTIKEMAGITAEKIAAKMGCRPSTVYRLWGRYCEGPNNKRPASIKVDTLVAFANACGYDLELVFRKKEKTNG